MPSIYLVWRIFCIKKNPLKALLLGDYVLGIVSHGRSPVCGLVCYHYLAQADKCAVFTDDTCVIYRLR